MQFSLTSDSLTVTFNEKGAELCSVKNKEGLEFIWQADPDIWPRHAPVLFPVVGKLKDNRFLLNGNSYSLSQHGFARDKEFTLVEQDNNSCTFELRADSETKKNYPFDFILRISYTLDQATLITRYEVRNTDTKDLLFSIGAHPGFNCPLLETEAFEDYYLELEANDLKLSALKEGLRTSHKSELLLENKRLPLNASLFDKDALVFENKQIHAISLCSSRSQHKITLRCQDWPYFGIWSKKGCTEFVCLEPWYGIADTESAQQDLRQKEGIICLEPGRTFDRSFSVSFA